MSRHSSFLGGSALLLALVAGPAFAASAITGTVTYTGKVPSLKPVAMDADPGCAAKHSAPVQNEMLTLGPGNTLANVMVRVKSPVPAGGAAPSGRCASAPGRSPSDRWQPSRRRGRETTSCASSQA